MTSFRSSVSRILTASAASWVRIAVTVFTQIALVPRIRYGAEVLRINLKDRLVTLTNETQYHYDALIKTLPLPVFLAACEFVPAEILKASRDLSCSQLLLVNVAARHHIARKEN